MTNYRRKVIEVWDADGGQHKFQLQSHDRGIAAMSFSDDSTLLASISVDLTAKIWDMESGKRLHTIFNINPALNVLSFEVGGKHHSITFVPRCFKNIFAAASGPSHNIWARHLQLSTTRLPFLDFIDHWIYRDTKPIIRLPIEFEMASWAASETILVAGCLSGAVLIFELPQGIQSLGEA